MATASRRCGAGSVLYCAAEDAWYLWDDKRWARDGVREVRERAKVVVGEFRRVLGEKQGTCGQNGIAPYPVCADYSKGMGSDANISAMLRSAQSKPEIRVTLDEFDADPLLFNCLNGTVELDTETGRVSSHLHNPADKITRLAPVNFYENAKHPLFEQYLERFFPESERRAFLGENAGYALTGLPKRHASQLIGPHDAGKSTTLKLFGAVWGDYGASLGANNLTKNPHKSGGDVGRPDLWRVRKMRLVTVSEVAPDDRLDVALFKSITSGGDKHALRTFFDATGGEDTVFSFALWMSGNKPYGPLPDEEAAFARLDVLDCSHVVAEGERDSREERDLTDAQEARDAAFAFALHGFARLYGDKHGVLTAPESSQAAKRKLIVDLDHWSAAMEELFEFTGHPDDGVKKSEAWREAREVLQSVRNSYREQQSFEDSMRRHRAVLTHRSSRFGNAWYWEGVRWAENLAEGVRTGESFRMITLPDWTRGSE